MTLNEIDSYLLASRQYIDNSKRMLASMGYCPYVNVRNPIPGYPMRFQVENPLQDLEDRQSYLERMAWNERHKDGSMGIWWLAVGVVGVASSYIASYIYDHYTKAKMQSDYYDCLDKYQTDYGMSPEEAKKICGSGNEGVKESITNIIKLGIYGAVAVMALYVASKYLGKRR
jgi:hypothetical protein